MAGSHEMSSTIGVPDSVHATGSLSGMFDDAATSTVAAAAAAAVTELALGVSEHQSIDAANVGSTASASQQASSSSGPSARHRRGRSYTKRTLLPRAAARVRFKINFQQGVVKTDNFSSVNDRVAENIT